MIASGVFKDCSGTGTSDSGAAECLSRELHLDRGAANLDLRVLLQGSELCTVTICCRVALVEVIKDLLFLVQSLLNLYA